MKKSIVIVQARTNSSRLPGKVLLPIKGIPVVVLAARRAANNGREVIVATSDQPSDNALTSTLINANIRHYRGSLEDTLHRFIGALKDYSEETLVFRVTADNVFPDGSILDEIEEKFLQQGLNYLCCNGKESGLPYGMSAELTWVKHLREAARNATSQHDREHVTPYIRRKFGDTFFDKYKHLQLGHFRCTIDSLDDYLSIQEVFSDVKSPELASAFELIDHLKKSTYQPLQAQPATKLILGTAQLGLEYGIANQSGKPDQATAEKIIKTAIANGSLFIDTARAYGNSEQIIGDTLKSGWQGRASIITKLDPLTDCPLNASTSTINAFVDTSIYHSCAALRNLQLDILMLHRTSHISDWNGAVWMRLLQHKEKGTLRTLGASVQNPDELKKILLVPEIELVQMPFNVLDWRWDEVIPMIREAKKQRNLSVHIRSALLQGLLSSIKVDHWRKANVNDPTSIIAWLDYQRSKAARSSLADFCLSFVKSLDWVDGLVIGVENQEQLIENIRIVCGPDISQQSIQDIKNTRPFLEKTTLDPACWRT